MKIIVTLAALASFSMSASAQEISLNSLSFSDIQLNQVKAPEVPVPQVDEEQLKCVEYNGAITDKLYLSPQTGKTNLFTYVDNEKEFQEFQDLWKPILEKNGLKVTSSELKNGFAVISYESAEGLVIRDFWADGMNYDALNKEEMNKLKKELLCALDGAGMKAVAAFDVNNPAVRPTFKLYYLTKGASSSEKEIQLRQLKNGENIDFELLENRVQFVKKDSEFSLVYIGKELGFVSKLAKDQASADKKVADYKKFLTDNKKELIDYKVIKLDEQLAVVDMTFDYLVNFYFFQ